MHHVLRVTELQQLVMEYVLVDDAYGRRTLAYLARTCRALHEQAVDVLWRELNSFAPLIKCMPQDLWQETTISEPQKRRLISFVRPIRAADWCRLNHYVRRIRNLRIYWCHRSAPPGHQVLHQEVYEALARRHPQGGLLPNLRSLTMWDPTIKITFLQAMLNPRLTLLVLEVRPGPDAATLDVLSSIPYKSPSLKRLKIDYIGADDVISETISTCVLKLRHLHNLDVCTHSLEDDTLFHLSTLAELYSLKIQELCHVAHPRLLRFVPPTNTISFVALRDISICTRHIETCTALINMMHSSKLQCVQFLYETWASASLIRACLRAIGRLGSRGSLWSIRLVHQSGSEDAPPIDPLDCILDGSAFRPLLVCHNLKALELEVCCSFALDDGCLKEMAQSWTPLHELLLSLSLGVPNRSRITLEGLLPLVEKCLDLELLQIPLDPHTVEPDVMPDPRISNRAITSLTFASSTLGDPRVVALFLIRLFPSLESITVVREQPDEPWDEYEPWKCVQRAMRWLKHIPALVRTLEGPGPY